MVLAITHGRACYLRPSHTRWLVWFQTSDWGEAPSYDPVGSAGPGSPLSAAERREAEGLVELAEFLSLLKLRAKRPARSAA